MKLRILTLEHFRADGPGEILGWAARRDYDVRRVLLDEGHELPALEDFDFLIVMGGPMSIYEHEQHPWLLLEKEFLRATVDAGKPILGICLGAQLLADVLGGPVTHHREREIGWWPVRFGDRRGPFAAFPETLVAFHWHSDTFALPPRAELLASSDACENQAFMVGDRLVGLQFHIEVGKIETLDLTSACAADLQPGPAVQPPEQILAGPPDPVVLGAALDSLLDGLAARAGVVKDEG